MFSVIDGGASARTGTDALRGPRPTPIDRIFTAEQKGIEQSASASGRPLRTRAQDQIDAIVVSLNFEDDDKLLVAGVREGAQVARYWDELKLGGSATCQAPRT